MIEIIIATHSELAKSLRDSACMIFGKAAFASIHTLVLQEDGKGITSFEADASTLANELKHRQLLILCDLLGATPCNVCCATFRDHEYQMITGVNVPILLEVLIHKENKTLDELADLAVIAGREGIQKVKIEAVEIEEEDVL